MPIWQPDRLYMPDPKTLTSLVKKEVTIDATKRVGSRVVVLGCCAHRIPSSVAFYVQRVLHQNPD